MYDYVRRGEKEMPFGYTPIADIHGNHANMLMDFGVLRLKKGQVFSEKQPLECAYLLVYGEVSIKWNDHVQTISRNNCFDDSPWVLHLPQHTEITIEGVSDDSEITVHRTDNETTFDAKLYTPKDTPNENRGNGTMKETCTRIVRTVFDKSNAPWSNMILGEVINNPGKWSSYPPHIHPQPEIYYYKFNPRDGYGFSEVGDDVFKVFQNDTYFIEPNYTHPQVAGPGYALWYMWCIRHLSDNPYITPDFIPQRAYIKEADAEIWSSEKLV